MAEKVKFCYATLLALGLISNAKADQWVHNGAFGTSEFDCEELGAAGKTFWAGYHHKSFASKTECCDAFKSTHTDDVLGAAYANIDYICKGDQVDDQTVDYSWINNGNGIAEIECYVRETPYNCIKTTYRTVDKTVCNPTYQDFVTDLKCCEHLKNTHDEVFNWSMDLTANPCWKNNYVSTVDTTTTDTGSGSGSGSGDEITPDDDEDENITTDPATEPDEDNTEQEGEETTEQESEETTEDVSDPEETTEQESEETTEDVSDPEDAASTSTTEQESEETTEDVSDPEDAASTSTTGWRGVAGTMKCESYDTDLEDSVEGNHFENQTDCCDKSPIDEIYKHGCADDTLDCYKQGPYNKYYSATSDTEQCIPVTDPAECRSNRHLTSDFTLLFHSKEECCQNQVGNKCVQTITDDFCYEVVGGNNCQKMETQGCTINWQNTHEVFESKEKCCENDHNCTENVLCYMMASDVHCELKSVEQTHCTKATHTYKIQEHCCSYLAKVLNTVFLEGKEIVDQSVTRQTFTTDYVQSLFNYYNKIKPSAEMCWNGNTSDYPLYVDDDISMEVSFIFDNDLSTSTGIVEIEYDDDALTGEPIEGPQDDSEGNLYTNVMSQKITTEYDEEYNLMIVNWDNQTQFSLEVNQTDFTIYDTDENSTVRGTATVEEMNAMPYEQCYKTSKGFHVRMHYSGDGTEKDGIKWKVYIMLENVKGCKPILSIDTYLNTSTSEVVVNSNNIDVTASFVRVDEFSQSFVIVDGNLADDYKVTYTDSTTDVDVPEVYGLFKYNLYSSYYYPNDRDDVDTTKDKIPYTVLELRNPACMRINVPNNIKTLMVKYSHANTDLGDGMSGRNEYGLTYGINGEDGDVCKATGTRISMSTVKPLDAQGSLPSFTYDNYRVMDTVDGDSIEQFSDPDTNVNMTYFQFQNFGDVFITNQAKDASTREQGGFFVQIDIKTSTWKAWHSLFTPVADTDPDANGTLSNDGGFFCTPRYNPDNLMVYENNYVFKFQYDAEKTNFNGSFVIASIGCPVVPKGVKLTLKSYTSDYKFTGEIPVSMAEHMQHNLDYTDHNFNFPYYKTFNEVEVESSDYFQVVKEAQFWNKDVQFTLWISGTDDTTLVNIMRTENNLAFYLNDQDTLQVDLVGGETSGCLNKGNDLQDGNLVPFKLQYIVTTNDDIIEVEIGLVEINYGLCKRTGPSVQVAVDPQMYQAYELDDTNFLTTEVFRTNQYTLKEFATMAGDGLTVNINEIVNPVPIDSISNDLYDIKFAGQYVDRSAESLVNEQGTIASIDYEVVIPTIPFYFPLPIFITYNNATDQYTVYEQSASPTGDPLITDNSQEVIVPTDGTITCMGPKITGSSYAENGARHYTGIQFRFKHIASTDDDVSSKLDVSVVFDNSDNGCTAIEREGRTLNLKVLTSIWVANPDTEFVIIDENVKIEVDESKTTLQGDEFTYFKPFRYYDNSHKHIDYGSLATFPYYNLVWKNIEANPGTDGTNFVNINSKFTLAYSYDPFGFVAFLNYSVNSGMEAYDTVGEYSCLRIPETVQKYYDLSVEASFDDTTVDVTLIPAYSGNCAMKNTIKIDSVHSGLLLYFQDEEELGTEDNPDYTTTDFNFISNPNEDTVAVDEILIKASTNDEFLKRTETTTSIYTGTDYTPMKVFNDFRDCETFTFSDAKYSVMLMADTYVANNNVAEVKVMNEGDYDCEPQNYIIVNTLVTELDAVTIKVEGENGNDEVASESDSDTAYFIKIGTESFNTFYIEKSPTDIHKVTWNALLENSDISATTTMGVDLYIEVKTDYDIDGTQYELKVKLDLANTQLCFKNLLDTSGNEYPYAVILSMTENTGYKSYNMDIVDKDDVRCNQIMITSYDSSETDTNWGYNDLTINRNHDNSIVGIYNFDAYASIDDATITSTVNGVTQYTLSYTKSNDVMALMDITLKDVGGVEFNINMDSIDKCTIPFKPHGAYITQYLFDDEFEGRSDQMEIYTKYDNDVYTEDCSIGLNIMFALSDEKHGQSEDFLQVSSGDDYTLGTTTNFLQIDTTSFTFTPKGIADTRTSESPKYHLRANDATNTHILTIHTNANANVVVEYRLTGNSVPQFVTVARSDLFDPSETLYANPQDSKLCFKRIVPYPSTSSTAEKYFKVDLTELVSDDRVKVTTTTKDDNDCKQHNY